MRGLLFHHNDIGTFKVPLPTLALIENRQWFLASLCRVSDHRRDAHRDHSVATLTASSFNAFAILKSVARRGIETLLKKRDSDGCGMAVSSDNILMPPCCI